MFKFIDNYLTKKIPDNILIRDFEKYFKYLNTYLFTRNLSFPFRRKSTICFAAAIPAFTLASEV